MIMTGDGRTMTCTCQTQIDALKNLGWEETNSSLPKTETSDLFSDDTPKRGRPKKDK
jgi:hypothetical protein